MLLYQILAYNIHENIKKKTIVWRQFNIRVQKLSKAIFLLILKARVL